MKNLIIVATLSITVTAVIKRVAEKSNPQWIAEDSNGLSKPGPGMTNPKDFC